LKAYNIIFFTTIKKSYEMIAQKYQSLVFSFFMPLLMSGIMSLVITTFNLGMVSDLLSRWLNAWSFAFIVAFPVIIVVSPLVRFLVKLVIKTERTNVCSSTVD